MKKILAATLVGTMLATSSASILAAPSVQGGGAQQGNILSEQVIDRTAQQSEEQPAEQNSIGSLTGVTVQPLEEGAVTWQDITRDNYTEEQLAIIDSLNMADAETTVKAAMEELVELEDIKLFGANGEITELDTDMQELLDELLFLSPVWELTFDDVEPTEENPVICTFTVNNLTEDMEVYLLFECEEHGWELLATEKTEDNQVKVAIHSTSAPATLVYRQEGESLDIAEGTSPVAAEAQVETESMTESVTE